MSTPTLSSPTPYEIVDLTDATDLQWSSSASKTTPIDSTVAPTTLIEQTPTTPVPTSLKRKASSGDGTPAMPTPPASGAKKVATSSLTNTATAPRSPDQPASQTPQSVSRTPGGVSAQVPRPGSTPSAGASASNTNRPTHRPTPAEDTRKLHDVPPVAERFAKTYVDPFSDTPLRDSQSFSVKPPFWHRWPTSRYMRLAEHVREQFDPVPFAAQEGLTVEEVQHLFTAAVCEPLYDAAEETRKRCEKSMDDMFHALARGGEQVRLWGIQGKFAGQAELSGVRAGAVELLSKRDGHRIEMKWGQLSDGDRQYLEKSVTKEQMEMLRGGLEQGKQ